jgi:hypothetical protein
VSFHLSVGRRGSGLDRPGPTLPGGACVPVVRQLRAGRQETACRATTAQERRNRLRSPLSGINS